LWAKIGEKGGRSRREERGERSDGGSEAVVKAEFSVTGKNKDIFFLLLIKVSQVQGNTSAS